MGLTQVNRQGSFEQVVQNAFSPHCSVGHSEGGIQSPLWLTRPSLHWQPQIHYETQNYLSQFFSIVENSLFCLTSLSVGQEVPLTSPQVGSHSLWHVAHSKFIPHSCPLQKQFPIGTHSPLLVNRFSGNLHSQPATHWEGRNFWTILSNYLFIYFFSYILVCQWCN